MQHQTHKLSTVPLHRIRQQLVSLSQSLAQSPKLLDRLDHDQPGCIRVAGESSDLRDVMDSFVLQFLVILKSLSLESG